MDRDLGSALGHAKGANPLTPRKSERLSILIAEDDRVTALLLQTALAPLGYPVRVAHDGRHAWQLVGTDAPLVALLDLHLPTTSGLALCKRMRRRTEAPYSFIMIVSGCDDSELASALAGGADDIVKKPFLIEELVPRVKNAARLAGLVRSASVTARLDSATGVFNRRTWLDELSRDLLRAGRENTTIGVLLIRIDASSWIRRKHGIAAMESALRAIARSLASTFRPYDSLGRYTPTDLALAAPNCGGSAMLELAQRARRAIATISFPDATDESIPNESLVLPITASIGTASSEGRLTTTNALLDAAEQALRRARARGGNRVELAVEADFASSAG